MPAIETIQLRCQNPVAQVAFYRDVLGMQALADDSVGYGWAEATIQFLPGTEPYQPERVDLYWKIALAVPNIDLACEQLASKGVSLGTPSQFRDIGYLAHFRDPEGFVIELIGHTFEGEEQTEVTDAERLGGGAHLNLLTLRTANIQPIYNACLRWGMTALSIQPVDTHGFTLYFFAFTDERPPSRDLTAIENRTWLYRRPYTVLEIQHLHDVNEVRDIGDARSGYVSTIVSNAPDRFIDAELLRFVHG